MDSDQIIDPLEPKIKKKRIREKLDHLSHEEKLMRRKMKNRVSAQSACDRKRKLLSTLEKKIEVLLNGTETCGIVAGVVRTVSSEAADQLMALLDLLLFMFEESFHVF